MIGLPEVEFLDVEDEPGGGGKIHVETPAASVGCPACEVVARVSAEALSRMWTHAP